MSKDPKWRFRFELLKEIPQITADLALNEFSELFADFQKSFIFDHAYQVREQLWKNFNIFAERYGTKYAAGQLKELIQIIVKHQNYLFRISALRAVQICAQVLNDENELTPVLTTVLEALKDEKIPNVMMELVNALGVVHAMLGQSFKNGAVRDRLEKLTINEEFDVSFFAKKGMKVIFSSYFQEFVGVNKNELKFEVFD